MLFCFWYICSHSYKLMGSLSCKNFKDKNCNILATVEFLWNTGVAAVAKWNVHFIRKVWFPLGCQGETNRQANWSLYMYVALENTCDMKTLGVYISIWTLDFSLDTMQNLVNSLKLSLVQVCILVCTPSGNLYKELSLYYLYIITCTIVIFKDPRIFSKTTIHLPSTLHETLKAEYLMSFYCGVCH